MGPITHSRVALLAQNLVFTVLLWRSTALPPTLFPPSLLALPPPQRQQSAEMKHAMRELHHPLHTPHVGAMIQAVVASVARARSSTQVSRSAWTLAQDIARKQLFLFFHVFLL